MKSNDSEEIENFCKEYLNNIVNQFTFNSKNIPINKENSEVSREYDVLNDKDLIKEYRIYDKFTIYAIKNFAQQTAALCGYHTLFNYKNYIRYVKSTCPNKKRYYIEKMNSVVKFWMFYNKYRDYLLKNCYLSDLDRESMMDEGPLEREQLSYLLEYHPTFLRLNKSDKENEIWTLKIYYGHKEIQGTSHKDTLKLQKKLEEIRDFKSSEKNLISFIFLGVTAHWVLLILEKPKNSNEIFFKYLDSNNVNLFSFKTSQDICDFVENENRKRPLYGKKLLDDFRKDLYRFLITDLNEIIDIVFKITAEKQTKHPYTLMEQIIEENTRQLIANFSKIFDIEVKSTVYEDYCTKYSPEKEFLITKERVGRWLGHHYHPKVLNEFFCDVIADFQFEERVKTLEHYPKLKYWMDFWYQLRPTLYQNLDKDSDEEVCVLVERLFSFLEKLNKQIF